jgi:hypothetical protein
VEAGEAGLASQKLLHRRLLEVALLGDELGQRRQQGIDIAQRRRNCALFGQKGRDYWDRNRSGGGYRAPHLRTI